jgi:raffinose/stachyose/melibiose transport system permease protein
VIYGVLGGFRTNAQLAADPAGMPDPWVFDNYARVLAPDSAFWLYALNSTIIAVITTAIVVVFGIMAAYPLARYRFKGREVLFMVFVVGLLFPATVAIVPLFILLTQNFGMGNTWWGVALPQAAFALPMTVVILRPFLAALPQELEEASMLDGTSRIGFFWRILLPLSGPGMVTVGVLAFVGSWNSYLLPRTTPRSTPPTPRACSHSPRWR